MPPKKRLGRGLDALLSKPTVAISRPGTTDAPSNDGLKNLPLEHLQRGQYQPRVDMRQDSLEELAASIKSQGIVQPIVARPIAKKDGIQRYEIIAGERRWRATQLAGIGKIPAIIKQFNDQTAAAVSLIENIQRENLNPLEESNALLRLVNEFEMTHQQVADTVGRSRATVSNLLRLQELRADVKELLASRAIEMGHARALLGADSNEQSRLATVVVKKALSVRATESLVRQQQKPATKKPSVKKDPDISKLEESLSEVLGASVLIKQKTKGKGSFQRYPGSLNPHMFA